MTARKKCKASPLSLNLILSPIFVVLLDLILIVSFTFSLTSCTGAADPNENTNLIVETDKGTIEGKHEKGVTVYKGIPYAAPPINELRFAPPQEAEGWDGILECKEFKPSAMQKYKASDNKEGIKFNEDCLYLNIWAPKTAKKGDDLPVLVYIHGGSFSTGSPERPTFNGTKFAKDGVIQVDIEYRVNVFGFAAFEEMEEKYGYLGNAGLLDQIASLKWVQKNIGNFGGDKNNVTLCGESAGAISVSDLLISPEAKGLFNKAIMESGNRFGQPIIAPLSGGDRASTIVNTKKIMKKVGARSLKDMQKIDANELVDDSTFSVEIHNQSSLYFLPVFDGKLLPEDPLATIEEGKINCDIVLTGYNTNEGSMFVPKDINKEEYKKLLEKIFKEDADKVYTRFPVDKNHTGYDRAEYLITMGLVFGSQIDADRLSGQGKDVYFYNFDYISPQNKEKNLGATHTAELCFVFDTLTMPQRSNESEKMVEQIHNRWISFVKHGNPNKYINEYIQDGIKWPKYKTGEKNTMQLNIKSNIISSPLEEDAEFLLKILYP